MPDSAYHAGVLLGKRTLMSRCLQVHIRNYEAVLPFLASWCQRVRKGWILGPLKGLISPPTGPDIGKIVVTWLKKPVFPHF
jgi:hypothetical protein